VGIYLIIGEKEDKVKISDTYEIIYYKKCCSQSRILQTFTGRVLDLGEVANVLKF